MNCPTHPNVKLICPACNGAHTSEAKKKASRENGKKGGWPKGKPRKVKEIAKWEQQEK